jgi:hypothetical protein
MDGMWMYLLLLIIEEEKDPLKEENIRRNISPATLIMQRKQEKK